MYCNHCGKKLSEDDFFCSNCGTRVERGDIWSGSDDGSFDETVLYNPNDVLDALRKDEKSVTSTEKPNKPESIRSEFGEGKETSNSDVHRQDKAEKSSEWILNDTAKPLFKESNIVDKGRAERQKEDLQMQISREQSARAAKRLQDCWKKSADEAQGVATGKRKDSQESEADLPEQDKGIFDNFRKVMGFDSDKNKASNDESVIEPPDKKTTNNKKKFGFLFSKNKEAIKDNEELNEKTEREPVKPEKEKSGMAGLFMGIVLLGLVIGVILGLVIAKPWIGEEEEPPENPTPLMVVTPYIN